MHFQKQTITASLRSSPFDSSTASVWLHMLADVHRMQGESQVKYAGVKNGDIFVLFSPVQTASAPFMLAVPFPFHIHACTISKLTWSIDMHEMKAQLAHSPTVLYCYSLLNSSGAVH